MNEMHGFSKQYDVCINEIKSGVWLRYMDFLRAFLKSKIADQITEG